MAELLLFHHALGLTAGCRAFAEDLRAAGHIVHTPDLYAGRTFTDLAEGMAHVEELRMETIVERGLRAAAAFPGADVFAGLSLGVMPAQALAQTRPGARRAVLMHAAAPPSAFGGPWPAGVALQLHTMEDDALGDADVARELAADVEGAELFLYPGDRHLFTDRGLPDHDADAAELVRERVVAFLSRIPTTAGAR